MNTSRLRLRLCAPISECCGGMVLRTNPGRAFWKAPARLTRCKTHLGVAMAAASPRECGRHILEIGFHLRAGPLFQRSERSGWRTWDSVPRRVLSSSSPAKILTRRDLDGSVNYYRTLFSTSDARAHRARGDCPGESGGWPLPRVGRFAATGYVVGLGRDDV